MTDNPDVFYLREKIANAIEEPTDGQIALAEISIDFLLEKAEKSGQRLENEGADVSDINDLKYALGRIRQSITQPNAASIDEKNLILYAMFYLLDRIAVTYGGNWLTAST